MLVYGCCDSLVPWKQGDTRTNNIHGEPSVSSNRGGGKGANLPSFSPLSRVVLAWPSVREMLDFMLLRFMRLGKGFEIKITLRMPQDIIIPDLEQ